MLRPKYIVTIVLTILFLSLASPLPISALEDEISTGPLILGAASTDDNSEIAPPSGVVAPDRVWRVFFNQSVDPASITLQSLYVTKYGIAVPGVTLKPAGGDSNVVEVCPPTNGYTPGDYELIITSGLISGQTGKELKQGKKMKFTVLAPLKIGAILPISSQEGDCGLQQQKGMELAVMHVNALGGINGQPLEIVYKDDCGASELSRSSFQELASQGVPLILGLPFNSAALTVAPLAEDKRLPVIMTTASDIHLNTYTNYVFKLSPQTDYEAVALSETIKERGWDRVAVIYNDTDYGRDLLGEFSSEYIGFNHHIVAALPCPLGATNFDSQMMKIGELAKNSDDPLVILFLGHAADLMCARYEAGRYGINAYWIGADETVEDDIAAIMPEGFLAVHPMAIVDNDPVSETFKSEWAKFSTGSPDPDVAFAYDSVLMAAQALQQSTAPGSDLDQILHSAKFYGVTGHKSFEDKGSTKLALYDLWQIKDKSWHVIRRWLAD